jgi:hypothetical protein
LSAPRGPSGDRAGRSWRASGPSLFLRYRDTRTEVNVRTDHGRPAPGERSDRWWYRLPTCLRGQAGRLSYGLGRGVGARNGPIAPARRDVHARQLPGYPTLRPSERPSSNLFDSFQVANVSAIGRVSARIHLGHWLLQTDRLPYGRDPLLTCHREWRHPPAPELWGRGGRAARGGGTIPGSRRTVPAGVTRLPGAPRGHAFTVRRLYCPVRPVPYASPVEGHPGRRLPSGGPHNHPAVGCARDVSRDQPAPALPAGAVFRGERLTLVRRCVNTGTAGG